MVWYCAKHSLHSIDDSCSECDSAALKSTTTMTIYIIAQPSDVPSQILRQAISRSRSHQEVVTVDCLDAATRKAVEDALFVECDDATDRGDVREFTGAALEGDDEHEVTHPVPWHVHVVGPRENEENL